MRARRGVRVCVCVRAGLYDVTSSKTLLLYLNHLRRCINIDYAVAAALERCSSPLDDHHCGYRGTAAAAAADPHTRGTGLCLRERVPLTENTVISDV